MKKHEDRMMKKHEDRMKKCEDKIEKLKVEIRELENQLETKIINWHNYTNEVQDEYDFYEDRIEELERIILEREEEILDKIKYIYALEEIVKPKIKYQMLQDSLEWQNRVRTYFGDEEMMGFYDWMKEKYGEGDE